MPGIVSGGCTGIPPEGAWDDHEKNTTVTYQATNGHLMEYWEDDRAQFAGRPAPACIWHGWHAMDCGCGKLLPGHERDRGRDRGGR
jgi:hypothetical protein